MIDAQVVAFTFVAAVLTLTPGADTMLVLRNVLRGGRAQGINTTFGICSGLFIHATLSALGLSVILLHSATAFHLVKSMGACYLVVLGLQSLYSAVRGASLPESMDQPPGTGASPLRCFHEGLLCNVLNPKVAVFYLAFLPQFIGPADPVLPKSLLLAGIHFAESLLWLITVSTIADQTRRFFVKPVVRRWMDGLCGALLIGLGARLAHEQQ